MEWPQSGHQSQVVSPKGLSSVFIIINDTDLCLNNFISKFVDTKIGNAVLSESDRPSLQGLRKIWHWSVKWEIPFNINKCQILQTGSRNIKNDFEMRGV